MHFRYLPLILSASAALALPTGAPLGGIKEHPTLGGTHGMGAVAPAHNGPHGIHPPRAFDDDKPSKPSLKSPADKVPNPVRVGLGRDESKLPPHPDEPHPPTGFDHKAPAPDHDAPQPDPKKPDAPAPEKPDAPAPEKPDAPAPEKPDAPSPKKPEGPTAPEKPEGKPEPPTEVPFHAPAHERDVNASAKEKAPFLPKNKAKVPAKTNEGPVKAQVQRDVAANAAVHPPNEKPSNGSKTFSTPSGKAPNKVPSKVTVTRNHTGADAHVDPKPKNALEKSHVEAVTHDH